MATLFDLEMRGLSASRRVKRLCQGQEDIAVLVRRAAEGKGSALRTDAGDDGHEVSILSDLGMAIAQGSACLDDDHPAAATRAAARRRKVFSLTSGLGARTLGGALRCGERLADALDVARTTRAGEQAVVADAMEAARQHVQEKSERMNSATSSVMAGQCAGT